MQTGNRTMRRRLFHSTVTLLAFTVLSLCLLPAGASASRCRHDISFGNHTSDKVDVEVKDIKFMWKKGANWKDRKVYSGPKTLTYSDTEKWWEKTQRVTDTMGFCYRNKWTFKWKCKQDSSYHSTTTRTEYPDSDRNTNFYVKIKGCSSGNLTITDDSSWTNP